MSIKLFGRGDRLGANIFNFLTQVIYAVHNKLYIKYDRNNIEDGDHVPYPTRINSSIFIQSIFDYIDDYNKSFTIIPHEIVDIKTMDFFIMMSRTLLNIKCDMFTYFKKHMFDSIKDNFLKKSIEKQYHIPFNPHKTILVHLRLDDCRYSSDYDGRICSYVFQTSINNDIIADNNLHNNLTNKIRCNGQAPINFNRIQEQIDKALLKYPDYEVIIITNPGENLNNIPYRKIQNYDESYDLFLLCNSDVLIMSRSTYSLCPLFFGIVKDAYIPLWGHLPCFGLYTKYDHNNFNYFY